MGDKVNHLVIMMREPVDDNSGQIIGSVNLRNLMAAKAGVQLQVTDVVSILHSVLVSLAIL